MDKKIKDFVDQHGLLTAGPQGGMDGGDSMARTLAMAYCITVCFPDRSVTDQFEAALNALKASNDKYVRNPDPKKWYSNTENVSRDQITPFLAYLIASRDHWGHRWNLAWQHAKRAFLFAFNSRKNAQYPTQALQTENLPDVPWDYSWKLPDPTFMEIWAMWIRAFRAWPLYPLLYILDLQTLGNAIYRKLAYYFNSPPDIDSVNSILPTHASATFMPSLVGMLAWRILKSTPIANELAQFYAARIDQPPIDQYVLKLCDLAYQNDAKLPCED